MAKFLFVYECMQTNVIPGTCCAGYVLLCVSIFSTYTTQLMTEVKVCSYYIQEINKNKQINYTSSSITWATQIKYLCINYAVYFTF